MKKAIFVAVFLVGVISAVLFVVNAPKKATVSQTAHAPNSKQAQPDINPMNTNDRSSPVQTTSSPGVTVMPVPVAQPIPPELKGATQDPSVAEFWSSHRPQEIGEVRPTNAQTKQLWVNGQLVFEAAAIKNVRSRSQDGTIALAAISEEPSTTVPKDDIALSEKPSRIWLVDTHGNKRSISPPGIDASKPLIAPGANAVAFTGSRVGSGGIGASNQLFVVDLKSGTSRIFNANQPLDDYSVTAVEWADGGKTLKVIEDHGETGGHMVMRQIRLE